MERITYNLLTKTLTAPDIIVCNADNETVELAIDSTGTIYETWEKRCDLAMPDGTTDILGFSPAVTDVIAVFILTSAHLKKGALVINPYVQDNGARKGFPKKSVQVVSQLSNDSATASVQVLIEDYIDQLLTVKSVTATPVAYGELPTASITQAVDGLDVAFEIPNGYVPVKGTDYFDGDQGIQGIQGLKGNQWRGAYSGATAYVVDDVVSYLGSSYICILASTNNLPTNTTYWSLFATTGTAIASNVTNTPSGNISATNVQTALNELDTEKANKTQEAWITPTLINSWAQQFTTPRYYKDQFGVVRLTGTITGGGVSTDAFILPVSYRPLTNLYLVARSASGAFGTITITTGGGINIANFNTWISLDNVSFRT